MILRVIGIEHYEVTFWVLVPQKFWTEKLPIFDDFVTSI